MRFRLQQTFGITTAEHMDAAPLNGPCRGHRSAHRGEALNERRSGALALSTLNLKHAAGHTIRTTEGYGVTVAAETARADNLTAKVIKLGSG